jgi:hypothetical protein
MLRKALGGVLVVGAMMLSSQPASAGGPFRDCLFDNFCRGLPYHEKAGCNGYLQYRIQRGRNRDRAIELCVWGCGEIYDVPTKIEDCRKGCRDVHSMDN